MFSLYTHYLSSYETTRFSKTFYTYRRCSKENSMSVFLVFQMVDQNNSFHVLLIKIWFENTEMKWVEQIVISQQSKGFLTMCITYGYKYLMGSMKYPQRFIKHLSQALCSTDKEINDIAELTLGNELIGSLHRKCTK